MPKKKKEEKKKKEREEENNLKLTVLYRKEWSLKKMVQNLVHLYSFLDVGIGKWFGSDFDTNYL